MSLCADLMAENADLRRRVTLTRERATLLLELIEQADRACANHLGDYRHTARRALAEARGILMGAGATSDDETPT